MKINEALKVAIGYENRVRDHYKNGAAQILDPKGKKVFETLGKEEQGHVDYLESRLDEWTKHGRVESVPLAGCLHLKSACSFIPPDVLLVNPAWVDPTSFGQLRAIAVDEREPQAANTLTIRGTTLVSSAYPHTRERLEAAGVRTRAVDVSELHKAEGGLTCMSLLLG